MKTPRRKPKNKSAAPQGGPLTRLRDGIDGIDSELIDLLNRRADLVHEIGEIKRTVGSPIYVPEREEQLLRSLVRRSKGRLGAGPIRAIYREIMSASLALEKDLAIACLGPEGTWSHQAARNKFGASVRYIPLPTIRDVFKEVEKNRADYGVVPIENSTEGAVNHTLDLFGESNLRICAQIHLRIEHNLVARIPRDRVRRIISHPQVLGQCRQWLQQYAVGIPLLESDSTSQAAATAARSEDTAAITGVAAAEIYDLRILEANIQDSGDNTTRFLVIGHTTSRPTGHDKTSLTFSICDRPGALYSALRPFQKLALNLSKIESRPSKRKAWEYVFFVDIEGHAEDAPVAAALEELRRHCSYFKVLGSYPNAGE